MDPGVFLKKSLEEIFSYENPVFPLSRTMDTRRTSAQSGGKAHKPPNKQSGLPAMQPRA
jgi:hypothetical protein